jgi:hypothetical protein
MAVREIDEAILRVAALMDKKQELSEMTVPPDREFYWDWYKHEETLATNRASFFLVGQSMLFAGYGALRAANSPPVTAISAFCILGVFAGCIWLLVTILHAANTRYPVVSQLNLSETRHEDTPRNKDGSWRDAFKSYFLMGLFLPVGIIVVWIVLLCEGP